MEGEQWTDARNILCVRLDSMGDVLMTTPAIRALKESSEGRHITLLTSSAGAAIAPLVPEVDETIVYDAPWMKATPKRNNSSHERAVASQLRQRHFHGAAIFTVFSQNPLPAAFLCYLADIPLRLAYCRENPYQLLTHWVPDPEPQTTIRHEVRRHLDLVASIGCHTTNERLSLRVPEAAVTRVRSLLRDLGLTGERRWAVMHPGASAPSRRYPWQAYAEVARRLVAEHGWTIVLTGTESERELVDAIRGAMDAPAHSLVGRLALSELAALVSLAPVLISNNTGPVHIAAAVGTPVVDLYALTNPQHTPWAVPSRVLFHDVPCKNCYKSICPEGHQNCLRLVTPESVVAAALELLEETQRSLASTTA